MKIAEMSVELIDSMGSDVSVARSARVSFAKKVKELDLVKDVKLINYLAKHSHFTPFTHCFSSFRIKVPIFVARQLHKHQIGLSVNEESRRYVSDEPEFYMPENFRGKPINAKQGSSDEIIETVNGFGVQNLDIDLAVNLAVRPAIEGYHILIAGGVAPEQARMVLPLNTMTNFIWSGSLAAFARVCKLRLDSHSQQETRDVAVLISAHMSKLFPHSWESLMTYTK